MRLSQAFCGGWSLEQGRLASGIVSSVRSIVSIVIVWFIIVEWLPGGRQPQFLCSTAGLMIMFGLFNLISSGLLFTALVNKKPIYLIPWLVWQFVEIFFDGCIVFISLQQGGRKAVLFIGPFTFLSICLYILVFNYYRSLQRYQLQVELMRIIQINLAACENNQPMYAVSVDPNYPIAPMTAYNAGMAPLHGYDPKGAGLAAMTGYDPREPPVGPIPIYDFTGSGISDDAGKATLDTKITPQYPTSSEYTTNPPPYNLPLAYS